MKPDIEKALATAIILECGGNRYQPGSPRRSVRAILDELAPRLGFVHKQAWRTLEKWCYRGWYEYGTTLDLGWLTDEGLTHFREAITEADLVKLP